MAWRKGKWRRYAGSRKLPWIKIMLGVVAVGVGSLVWVLWDDIKAKVKEKQNG